MATTEPKPGLMPDPELTDEQPATRFPTAFSILFALIVFVAALTWFIPAGQYDKAMNEAVGKEVAVAGTYKTVESTPQGITDILLAPIAGFYDPSSYTANAIDVALFVLLIGGFLGVVNATGAIDTGITAAMRAMKGRERWMIPALMALFAAGGTTYGMAEETMAFYAILLPAVIIAGYDAITGVAIILLGAGIGVLGSTINPFATTIASNAAGIPFTNGLPLRIVLLVGGWAICSAYVMRYAARVKADPTNSVVANMKEKNEQHFLSDRSPELEKANLATTQKIVLLIFVATFGVMIWGVSSQGWWMAKMGALFIGASIVVGVVSWMGEKKYVESFIDGARDLLGVALVIGLARGIVVIMEKGKISDTVLNWAESSVQGLSKFAFIAAMFFVEVAMSFFVPSSSGLAVLSMPIMAPLADFSGVGRDLVVTAYQAANGLVNLINPTFAVVIGGLAIGRVPYDRWIVFIWPLMAILTVFILAVLGIGTML